MREQEIERVRDFNRYYTGIIGLLDNHILNSPFSLPEARVIYELGKRKTATASDITEVMRMDKGYLSRVLRSFAKKGLITRRQSSEDGRATILELTGKGKEAFRKIDTASAAQVSALLSRLKDREVTEVVNCMSRVRQILTKEVP